MKIIIIYQGTISRTNIFTSIRYFPKQNNYVSLTFFEIDRHRYVDIASKPMCRRFVYAHIIGRHRYVDIASKPMCRRLVYAHII